MLGGTGATEYKVWVATLNQLVFLPVAYYLEVFAREAKLYRFVHDPNLGKIDIMYTNYSFMHLEPTGLQSALLNLSNAIVKGMFECLHYFPSAMGVQKDLHQQGKRMGNGQGCDLCLNCFHYSDWDTIVNLFQYQNDIFQMPLDSPSSSILAAAGCGSPPGGGPAHGGGPPGGDPSSGGPLGHGTRGGAQGSKGATSLSGRSYCVLVQPKFGTPGVQHSAGTSQTQTQQTGTYSGTSQQRHQRKAELARMHTGTNTFPPHTTAHCQQPVQPNIQPLDIPCTHSLPIRGNLSNRLSNGCNAGSSWNQITGTYTHSSASTIEKNTHEKPDRISTSNFINNEEK